MVKDIVHDPIFLAQKSAPATAADLQTAQDLMDTLEANRDRCVGMAANMIGVLRRIIVFDNMGKPELGGGGTMAKFIAKRNIETIDVGVPLLSMHAPFELAAKIDCYMAYRAICALFSENKD